MFYQIKDSRKRESGYKTTVDALVNRLRTVVDIKNDLEEVGRTVYEVKAIVLGAGKKGKTEKKGGEAYGTATKAG